MSANVPSPLLWNSAACGGGRCQCLSRVMFPPEHEEPAIVILGYPARKTRHELLGIVPVLINQRELLGRGIIFGKIHRAFRKILDHAVVRAVIRVGDHSGA